MKPAAFKYFAPDSLEEALKIMAEYGYEAKILAGGQSLVPAMNFRLAQPGILVDLNRIKSLSYIRQNNVSLHIGAMTRHAAVEHSPVVREHAPLLFETMPYIAHPQIRNRGTIGGSIAHADPAAELPVVMAVLNAKFQASGVNKQRWINANEFFNGLFMTALEPDEILTEIAIPPLPPRSGCAFMEVARRHGDYALVGVACWLTLNADDYCEQARIGYLSVADSPVMAVHAQQALIGQKLDPKTIRAAAEIAASQDVDPPSDIHASSDYRRHLTKILTERALVKAVENYELRITNYELRIKNYELRATGRQKSECRFHENRF